MKAEIIKMVKQKAAKRVRFSRDVEQRNKSRHLPFWHCAEESCSEVQRYKHQIAHQKRYHCGKYATAMICKVINCKYCVYSKFSAS